MPRSVATDGALIRAVDAPAERGVLGPSSEHLIARRRGGPTGQVAGILDAVGIEDVEGLINKRLGERRAPVSDAQLKAYLLRVADRSSPPQPGPIPPGFERYTAEARRAVRAAIETAALLEHHDVEPFHLLLGCLHVPDSTAAHVVDAELAPSEMGTLGEAMERAHMDGPPPAHQGDRPSRTHPATEPPARRGDGGRSCLPTVSRQTVVTNMRICHGGKIHIPGQTLRATSDI